MCLKSVDFAVTGVIILTGHQAQVQVHNPVHTCPLGNITRETIPKGRYLSEVARTPLPWISLK
jgi:hypothetical protein